MSRCCRPALALLRSAISGRHWNQTPAHFCWPRRLEKQFGSFRRDPAASGWCGSTWRWRYKRPRGDQAGFHGFQVLCEARLDVYIAEDMSAEVGTGFRLRTPRTPEGSDGVDHSKGHSYEPVSVSVLDALLSRGINGGSDLGASVLLGKRSHQESPRLSVSGIARFGHSEGPLERPSDEDVSLLWG
jgi:hypothetical protein